MKKITALLTLISFVGVHVTPALAHIGGPYSGNTYDGFQGGVFQGTMTMRGGFGMFRFATGFEASISPQAASVVMVNGITHYGECFGMVDFPSRTASGITNSLSTLPNATTGQGNPNTFRNGQQDYVVNTNWQAKITSTRPTVLFRGSGEAYILNERFENTIATTVDRIEAAVDIPAPDPGSTPGSLTQATNQVINDTGLAVMERRRIRVSGTRLTPIAYNANYQAAPNADARN
jgi:hypothetical protein